MIRKKKVNKQDKNVKKRIQKDIFAQVKSKNILEDFDICIN